MTIRFYLDNEEETEITSFHDMKANPFNIGDEISLTVDEILPIYFRDMRKDYQEEMVKQNEKLESDFKRKKIKLIREGKYVRFNVKESGKLTIEYHCTLIN